jgi:hypothetical protein
MAPKTAGKTLPKTLYKIRGECSAYVERSKSETSLCDSCDGKNKLVVDKQGNDIFITETGYAPYYGYIGISEKDRIQSILDTVTSGRIKDGLFDKITYTGGR